MHTFEHIDNFSIANSCLLPSIDNFPIGKQKGSKYLNITHQNIRSISANLDNFLTLIHRTNVFWDIIILTECWLPKTDNVPNVTNYNYCMTTQNYTQNEGVVVYINSMLNVQVDEPNISDCNCLAIRINMDTLILAIYRPWGIPDPTNFIESLNQFLCMNSSIKNIVLMGDINIDIIDSSVISSSYLDTLCSHGMLPAYSFPTHNKTCLDHIILKTKQQAFCYVSETTVTDHYCTFLILRSNAQVFNQSCKSISRIDYVKLENALKSSDLNSIYSMTDVNLATSYLLNTLSNVILASTLCIKISNRKIIYKPWITPGILRCMRNRDNMHKKVKRNPNNAVLVETYKRYRNFCNILLKKLKRQYYKIEISSAANKCNRKLWRVITSATNINKNKSSATELLSSDPLASINKVNNFFVSICNDSPGKTLLYPPTQDTESSLKSHPKSLVLLYTDCAEIEMIILNLKSNSSAGRDNISGIILKRYRDILTEPITYICNLAISTGTFPDALKLAEVLPIHKSGNRDCVNNYRPISILPIISKILEKVINRQFTIYLENNNLLSKSQHGFRSGHSTHLAIHELTDYIVTNLDAKKKVIVIFLDISKAFDTVSVPLLLQKLELLGVRGLQLQLFRSYLSNRYQRVRIEQFVSNDLPINHGVPQGSVMGPTLFLTYINALCDLELGEGRIISFADDTALLFRGDSWQEVYREAQKGFDKVTIWLKNNKLKLNTDKTKFLTFMTKKYSIPEHENANIISHSCQPSPAHCTCPALTRTSSIKYLGVIIDDTLSFHEHIVGLTNRVRKLTFIFKNLRHVSNPNIIKMVYLALCQSILTYCIEIWGGAPTSTLLPLERAQRLILKISYFLPRLYPTRELYSDCKVLTVRQLFILHVILFKHSQLHFNPSYNNKRRKHTVCSTVTLRTKLASRFFCFLGSYLYNKLNNVLAFYSLSRYECKNKITFYLQNLDYQSSEDLLLAQIH